MCVRYRANHPESDFNGCTAPEGVLYYSMAYPNDEALKGHPLYSDGLGFYDVHLVKNSPLITVLMNGIEYITATFREPSSNDSVTR